MRRIMLWMSLALWTMACTLPGPPEPPIPPMPPPVPDVPIVVEDPGLDSIESLLGPASTVAATADAEEEGVRIRADLRRDGLGVEVRAENRGTAVVQLLLQEWSITNDGETSLIVPGNILNREAQGACVGPVTLPPGGVYAQVLVMRARHGRYGGRFALEPMRGDVVLAYALQAGSERRLGTLALRPGL